jgi:glucoamylase
MRLRIAPDSRRDVLSIECRLDGDPKLKLYALLAPHLGATGYGNTAAVAVYRGRRVLWAEQGPFGLALAAVDEMQRDAITRSSAGYIDSDGWQDFARNGAMTWEYAKAGPGNVALMAELPRRLVLALGFGSSDDAAATLAIVSLLQRFDIVLQEHMALWQNWHAENRASCGAARCAARAGRPMPRLHRRAAQPPRQDLSRRDGRESERAVGRYRQ